MFWSPRVNVIESDEGFSVQILGITSLLYREEDRSIKVDSELLAERAIAVYHRRINGWNEPHQSEPVTETDRKRIAKNIRRAFEFDGRDVHFHPPIEED
jgi:Immunity protein 74